mmetsp:Transcript_28627/g.42360  ORF Transcript_28627/g.42360 Transcript_28627/m.42360 type:complete len:206 (+) Transcript_28627:393-1010(+)
MTFVMHRKIVCTGHRNAGFGTRIGQRIFLHLCQATHIRHERHHKSSRFESSDNIVDDGSVRYNLLIGFKASVRRSVFGGDMHGTVGTKENRIHTVSARFKRTGVDDCSWDERINTSFLGHGDTNAATGLFLRFVFLSRFVLIVVKGFSYGYINVKHHNVQHTIGIGVIASANGLISDEDKPMVRSNGTESVAIPLQPFAEFAMAR